MQIKAGHLQSADQELFIQNMTKFIENIAEGKQSLASSSSTAIGVVSGEDKSKLQSVEASQDDVARRSPHHETTKPVLAPSVSSENGAKGPHNKKQDRMDDTVHTHNALASQASMDSVSEYFIITVTKLKGCVVQHNVIRCCFKAQKKESFVQISTEWHCGLSRLCWRSIIIWACHKRCNTAYLTKHIRVNFFEKFFLTLQ